MELGLALNHFVSPWEMSKKTAPDAFARTGDERCQATGGLRVAVFGCSLAITMDVKLRESCVHSRNFQSTNNSICDCERWLINPASFPVFENANRGYRFSKMLQIKMLAHKSQYPTSWHEIIRRNQSSIRIFG